MKTSEHCFIVNYTYVQVQAGISDCGLFSIAFATALCSRKNSSHYSFDQTVTREHLRSCLESEVMSDFPACHRECHRTTSIFCSNKVEVHCKCRLPWAKELTEFGGLAQYKSCRKWFHQKCANISSEASQKLHIRGNVFLASTEQLM